MFPLQGSWIIITCMYFSGAAAVYLTGFVSPRNVKVYYNYSFNYTFSEPRKWLKMYSVECFVINLKRCNYLRQKD